MGLDEGRNVGEGEKIATGADAARRGQAPDGVEDLMQELAALRRGEASFCEVASLRVEAVAGKGLEGALRLRGEKAGAAAERRLTGGERNAGFVGERNGEGRGRLGREEMAGE